MRPGRVAPGRLEVVVLKKLVSELTPAELDYWVAKAEGLAPQIRKDADHPDGVCYISQADGEHYFEAHISWAIAGPIIQREKISMLWGLSFGWKAVAQGTNFGNFYDAFGHDPLDVALRCYLTSRFGELVEI